MIVEVKCLKCGRTVRVRIEEIEDALRLKCKECADETN
jgi:DNA-directed RNA polymerase subunit RPC12/RpoP